MATGDPTNRTYAAQYPDIRRREVHGKNVTNGNFTIPEGTTFFSIKNIGTGGDITFTGTGDAIALSQQESFASEETEEGHESIVVNATGANKIAKISYKF